MTYNLCQICCWNDAYILFDDSEYTQHSKYKNAYYNRTINRNCYNIIYTCHDCLLQNIYECDLDLKYKLLFELKTLVACKKIQYWWLNILYNIRNNVGKYFIMKHISLSTKQYFNLTR